MQWVTTALRSHDVVYLICGGDKVA